MDKEDIAFNKMAMLFGSIKQADQEPNEDFDEELVNEDDSSDTLAELKAAAFEILLTEPGSEFDDWRWELINNYGTELTDEFGSDPFDVDASISDLWETPYYDEASGLEYDFSEWALAFATEQSVQMYYDFISQHTVKK